MNLGNISNDFHVILYAVNKSKNSVQVLFLFF